MEKVSDNTKMVTLDNIPTDTLTRNFNKQPDPLLSGIKKQNTSKEDKSPQKEKKEEVISKEENQDKEEKKNPQSEEHSRLEVIGKQNTLFGEKPIELTQFKNLKEKRALKEKVKRMFNGVMFRSIITPRNVDGNLRLNKLERQHQSGNRDSNQNVMDRADSFGKKTLNTLSTFPSTLTIAYTTLLSKEGDKVIDPFMGHNSRAEDVLANGRKYYGYDVHKFPVDFTQKAIDRFPKENYELNLASSEKMQYENESMDFGFTCPPYADVEQYNKIYNEEAEGDLSSVKYEEFLRLYQKCISEVFRVLKAGSYFVIVIGDVHRQGKFISLSNDTDKICEQVGFIKHDENIYNRKSNIGGDLNYKTFILTCRRFPTIHEYILIYKKPEKDEKVEKTKIPTFIPSNPIDETTKSAEINDEEQLKKTLLSMGEIERLRYLRKLEAGKVDSPKINDEMESITLNKDIFDKTMELFNIKLKNCKYCNSPITKDNFGIITADTFVCNDIGCLFESVEEMDKEKNGENKNDN